MEKKIYYAYPLIRIGSMVMFPLAAGLTITTVVLTIQTIKSGDTSSGTLLPLISLVPAVLFCVYMAISFYGGGNRRLEFSEEGVMYYGGDTRIYSPWQNIATIGSLPLPFQRSTKTFDFREPARTDISIREGKLMRQAVIEKRWKFLLVPASHLQAYSGRIPLDIVTKKDWENGELLRIAYYYAPHLETDKVD